MRGKEQLNRTGVGYAARRRRALGQAEGDQEAATGGEGAGPERRATGLGAGEPATGGGGDPLGEADDRLAAGVAAEQQTGEQQAQQRHGGQQEGAKLGHGGPG